jgi:hypothetical protein
MSGAVPPFPQYASMVWCSVKAQGQPYLYRITVNRMVERFVIKSEA